MAYGILSLSGGGVRGVFQAVYLREIAKHFTGNVTDHFDLIAGTSTGAIIAMALALEIDPARIVNLFIENSENIFRSRLGWYISATRGPRYDGQALRKALENELQDAKLKDCKRKVLITATTLNRFALRTFSNLDGDESVRDLSAVDIILSSCAAPTFFAPVKPAGSERTYVDGGMAANTPSLLAIMLAHRVEGVAFSDIRLVDLGNGEFPNGAIAEVFGKQRAINPKLLLSLLDMMFATQAFVSDQIAEQLIGRANILRVNAHLEKYIGLDDARAAVSVLPALAEERAESTVDDLRLLLTSSTDRTPKVTLINDVIRSLYRYEYITSQSHEKQVYNILMTGSYIRSQNFYELLNAGLTKTKKEFLFVNDHPFKPFAELVMNNIDRGTKYIGINAMPDNLYSRADIERRINIIQSAQNDIKYYLLPAEDVHLSLLLFDKRFALVYPTPEDRKVCNFSEGLCFMTPTAVELCNSVFQHIENKADAYMKQNKLETLDVLTTFADFYIV